MLWEWMASGGPSGDGPHFAPLADYPAGLMYGMAVYTTFRLPLAPVWLAAHWTRLVENAGQLGLILPHSSLEPMRSALYGLAQREAWVQPVIRLNAIAHVQEYGDFFTAGGQIETLRSARLVLSVRQAPPDSSTAGGATASPLALQTVDAIRPLPLIKHVGMADVIRLRQKALQEGFHDILLAKDGLVREASTANLFRIQAGRLATPDPVRDGCLPGITRQRLLVAAQGLGIPVEELAAGPLLVSAVSRWDGAFLTNAAQGVRPVARINEHQLPWFAEATEIMQALAAALE